MANQEEAELADFDKDFFGFELSEEELGGVNLNDVMTWEAVLPFLGDSLANQHLLPAQAPPTHFSLTNQHLLPAQAPPIHFSYQLGAQYAQGLEIQTEMFVCDGDQSIQVSPFFTVRQTFS